MPTANLPSGQISFLDLANGTCQSTEDITMLSIAYFSGVPTNDLEMSIDEFRGKQVLYQYEATNYDENYDYTVSYTDEYCNFISYGVGPGMNYYFTAVLGTTAGAGNGAIFTL